MTRAFVIRPFGKKRNASGIEIDFEEVHSLLIKPALEATAKGGGTTSEIIEAGNIREDMYSLIIEADLVVCDITINNPNVFYELGIRHSLRQNGTVLIKGEPSDSVPFDLLTDRYLSYDVENPGAALDDLVNTIEATIHGSYRADSPIFQMITGLPEVDLERVQVVPLKFREKIRQARAAKDLKGLRKFGTQMIGQRYEFVCLQLIARAQSSLKDYESALESWEMVRKTYPENGEANVELARIYEQLYRIREIKDPVLLEKADQAISRVLKSRESTGGMHANALQIRGRILKTLWWLEFRDIENLNIRRERATNRLLIECYETYIKAFFIDLNIYYVGIAALELGIILLDLSETDSWKDAFDNDSDADRYKERLRRKINDLSGTVAFSIESAMQYSSQSATLDVAYQLFLKKDRASRVIRAHQDAYKNVQDGGSRARQLELFISLGINADLAEQVIAVLP